MKKFTIIFIVLLAFAGFSRAQVIENFESSIKMNLMAAGANGSLTVIPNPDTNAVNHSINVVKFVRGKGDPWGGFWGQLSTPIDVTTNKYVHVKVWKPRISPVKVKIEVPVGTGSVLETASMSPQTLINEWEELVFDFSALTGTTYNQFNLMPDFEDPLTITEDITMYFDDLYINNDPAVGSAPVQVIEDFETVPMTRLSDGNVNDASAFMQIPNPDPSGINPSENVLDFLRDKDAVTWTGFWSHPATAIDVTTNKYVHVKVWKPRISPVRFKLEGGSDGTFEIASMNVQTKVNAWEDIVFDFSAHSTTYPIFAIILDNDPTALTEDIHIYIDDILVNNDPTPQVVTVKTINVDMKGSGLLADQPVYISGDFGGVYGSWAEPGTKPGNEMTDIDADSIYSITIEVPDGTYHFKFFKGATWANGDNGPGDRALPIKGNLNITYKWGVKAANVTLNVDMHGSGISVGQPIYYAGTFGGNYGSWAEPGTNMNNLLTDADGDSIYSGVYYLGQIGTYKFKFFKGAGWDGGEWSGGDDRTLVVAKDTVVNLTWGTMSGIGIGENPLANKVSAYPVPFKNSLTINTLVDVKTVVISTSYGQQVARFENLAAGRTTVSTSDLSNGMYFITFYGKNGGQITQKLMKN
jgi:hypothetical protein